MLRGTRMARNKSSRRSKQSRDSKNIDETENLNHYDKLVDDKLASWQSDVNQNLYDVITELYTQVSSEFGPNHSVGLIVSAVSTNLGMILAQIPENARDSYINAASDIVQQSLVNTLEILAQQKHGQIGHA